VVGAAWVGAARAVTAARLLSVRAAVAATPVQVRRRGRVKIIRDVPVRMREAPPTG
jgi:hypothetical protein